MRVELVDDRLGRDQPCPSPAYTWCSTVAPAVRTAVDEQLRLRGRHHLVGVALQDERGRA